MAELEDGKEKEEETRKKKRKQGGLRTAPFILANEVCDRFAAAGFHANMISYLTLQLHMPLVQASNTLTNFGGTSNITPIIGGLIADSFAGRFWTITVGSLIYQLGMISLTVSAVLPAFRPPPCHLESDTKQQHPPPCQRASAWQLYVLYLSLLVTAVGSGGIRPCVMAFGADQFDLAALQGRGKKQQWSFFNLYYFSMGVALLMALTVVVYVQDNVGWGWGLGIPTIAMALSVVVFVAGYPLYIRMKPAGSPLTRLAQVVVAAFRKRKVVVPEDPSTLHQDAQLDSVLSVTGRLLHTDQLRFFDRAAVLTEADGILTTKPPGASLWRLSTVHRVEELKSVLRMLPIWVVGILSVTASSHNHSFAVQQARSMDRHLTPAHSFQIPPASMNVFTVLTMLLTLTLYDRLFVPLARRVTGHPAGITCLQRMGVGFAIGVFANVAAALVEAKRKATAARTGLLDTPATVVPITVFWLVPQYAIHGLAEAFSSVGHLEFLYDQAPESMRSTAVALSWLASSIGNYLGTFLVTQVQRCTRNANTGGWLQDNINRGNLDRYYWLVVSLQLLNLGYYLLCAKFYTYKPLEVAPKVADDGGAVHVETMAADAESKDGREEEPIKELPPPAALVYLRRTNGWNTHASKLQLQCMPASLPKMILYQPPSFTYDDNLVPNPDRVRA